MKKILYLSFVELDIPNACQTHTLGVLSGFSQNQCLVDAIVPRSINVRPEIHNVRFKYVWPWRFSSVGQASFKVLASLFMICLCIKNDYDAIYVREMEKNPGPRLCSRIFNIPLYMEINDLIVPVLKDNGANYTSIRNVQQCQKLDFNQADGLIVPSVPMCKWIVDQYGLPESKVHMVLNGAEAFNGHEIDRSQARKAIGIDDSCFCLVFLGNIYPEYDFDTILRAVAKVQIKIPMIQLLIIGDGPLTKQLKRKAIELGIDDNLIFTGYIPHEKLGKIFGAADVGLLIRTKKGTERYGPVSTKLSTYACFNIPVITAGRSLEGYPDELVNGLFLAQPEDPNALADLFVYLYTHPQEREQKANTISNFAKTKLTWNQVTKDILQVIFNPIHTN
jgi:glycosyltransferase involved in cell wall biosynthesis